VDARRARLDRQRDAELAGCGWQTLRLVDDDLAGMPQTVHRVRRLLELRARSALPRSPPPR
jgi:very-short-patch-repair endonuclease